eukprot:2602886-Rhodomonas_salina.1
MRTRTQKDSALCEASTGHGIARAQHSTREERRVPDVGARFEEGVEEIEALVSQAARRKVKVAQRGVAARFQRRDERGDERAAVVKVAQRERFERLALRELGAERSEFARQRPASPPPVWERKVSLPSRLHARAR